MRPPSIESNPVKRDFETGIVLLVACVLAAAAAITWWDIAADREVTLQESTRLTDALAGSVDDHIEATLRDAANAALSAAMLVEESGGIAAMKGERNLHANLKRELWDERSTARLVLADKEGNVLASSADYPIKAGARLEPVERWIVEQPGGRPFWIGAPGRSVIGGEWVIPYWCDILDARGEVAGAVRAELRIGHFVEALRPIADIHRGAVFVASSDGVVMLRVPLTEDILGTRSSQARAAFEASSGTRGMVVVKSPLDGVTRAFSWRRMQQFPLAVAIGLDKDAVLAGWERRAWRRTGVLAGASLVLVAMAFALALHLRRLARSQLRLLDVEARYWRSMESSSIGIAIATLDGRWLHVNPALCRMLGYRREELVGRDNEHLTAPEFRARRAWALESIASGHLEKFTGEKRLVHKSGREIWVHVHSVASREGADGRTGLIVHFQDITERHEAEQALRALNLQLEQRVAERTAELSLANKDLEAFSYSAAHDLRGPLTRLSMFIDLLSRDLGDTRAGVSLRLENIRRQVAEMLALIDNLLALARTSRTALREQLVPLEGLVRETIDGLAHEREGRAIEWRIGPLPAVRADRALLREALANLIGNALKYTRGREPAVIEIGTEASDDPREAVIYIHDNGAGFDMEYAGSLFTPFQRLHTAAQFEGSGIGLAIVQRIIERHGGRVWAEGETGRGATFRIALRAQQEAPQPQAA